MPAPVVIDVAVLILAVVLIVLQVVLLVHAWLADRRRD